MLAHFPDPIHIGAGPSLVIALIADFICSILIIVGLGTRLAALFSFVNLAVAWIFVHHFLFFGRDADHGEVVVLYMGVMLALTFAGAGRYSVDHLIAKKRN